MSIVPPGFAEVSLGFTRSGDPEPMYNVWGVDLNDLPPEEYGDLGPDFGNAFMAACVEAIDDSIVLTNIKVRIGNDGDPFVFEFAANIPGTDSYSIVPQNTAILVRKLSALGGRKGRGRAFLPWVSETSVSDAGVLTPTYVTAWQANMDDFITNRLDSAGTGLSVDLGLVILHNDATVPTPVTNLIVDPMVATQRRRLRR